MSIASLLATGVLNAPVVVLPIVVPAPLPLAPPGVAGFDYGTWTMLYPELASVSQARATALFSQAGLYLNNTPTSIVTDVGQRAILLGMIVAHLAALGGALEPDGKPTGLVGRVTSAGEGSVSVSVDAGVEPGSAGWYAQTTYGYQYWAATRPYRTMRYRPVAGPMFDPVATWRRMNSYG